MVESAQSATFYPVDRESGVEGCLFFTHILLGADIRMSGIKYLSGIFKLFHIIFNWLSWG